MLYLICAICCSAVLSVLMRLSEDRAKGETALLAVNYITCCAVAGFYAAGSLVGLPGGSTVALGSVGGGLFLLSFFMLRWNVSRNGVVLSSTFMKLGVLISIGVSVFLFGEVPGVFQVLGVVLAVAAILLINGTGRQSQVPSRASLCLLLLCGGLADAMSKFFEELGDPREESWFLLVTFLVAWLLSVLLMLAKKQRPGRWEVLFGILIGVPNYFSTRFFLRALETVPAVVAFPMFSVGAIVLVSLMGVLLFREKLGRRQWFGMALILGALVLLNL